MNRVKLSEPTDVREHNLRHVLDLLHGSGRLARVDLARATQLSRSTITNIVNDLLPTGLFYESGSTVSAVGRRPVQLEFDYGARALIGVDMGATHLEVVVLDLGGQLLAVRHEAFPVSDEPDAALARTLTLLREVEAEANRPRTQVLGIGVAVSAPLEGERLDRISSAILPKWAGMDLRRELAVATGLPVFLDNDANLGALAEHWWGHGREVDHLAFIKVGTGVGCGLIINGRIYRGAGGTAGEIGHTAIVPDGPLCRCGLNGCLEAVSGSRALVRAVQARLEAGEPSTLADHPALTVHEVVGAALAGDALAGAVIREAGRFLGIAIANLLNLVNPGLIVLGGEMTRAGDLLLAPLRQTVRARALAKSNAEATITTSRLGDDVVAVGAATLVFHHLLHVSDMPILQVLTPGGRS